MRTEAIRQPLLGGGSLNHFWLGVEGRKIPKFHRMNFRLITLFRRSTAYSTSLLQFLQIPMKRILSLLALLLATAGASHAQPKLQATWSQKLKDGIATPSSIGKDGTIYVASLGSPDLLHALKPNGSLAWSSSIIDDCKTAIAIGDDGTLYFGASSTLQAFRADGTEQWQFVTQGNVLSSPAIGADGAVYFGSADTKVYAVNPDGTLRWSFKTGGAVVAPLVIDSEGILYAGSNDRRFYALRLDGTKKWDFTTAGEVRNAPAIGSDGRIYLASTDGRLYAFNRDGSRAWTNNTSAGLTSVVLGADNTLYVGRGNSLAAYASDGKAKWAFDTGARVATVPAVAGDGTLFVGNEAGAVYAIDKSGGLVGVRPPDGQAITGSPVIGADGLVVVGAADGTLYGFARTNGGPNSPWPMLGGNASRSGALPPSPSGPPQITTRMTDLSVAPGSNAVIRVTVIGAEPLQYQWFRNDVPLTDGLNLSGTQSAVLRIDDAAQADSADYSVTISNLVGSITHPPVRLNVLPGSIPPGTTLWSATLGGNIVSSPALGSDGTVYVTTSDGSNGEDSSLRAFASTGGLKWKLTLGTPLWGSPLVGPNGIVYQGTMWPSNSVLAVTPDGKKLWELPVGNSVGTRLALGHDGNIYVTPNARGLIALGPEGTIRWEFQSTNRSFATPPSIGADGTIYTTIGRTDPVNGSPLADLIALRPDGTEKWRFNGDKNKSFNETAIAPDGRIVFGGIDKNGKSRIFAVQTNGILAWSTPGESLGPPSIAADGTIYAMGNQLLVLSATGQTNRVSVVDPSRNTSVALAADGSIQFAGFLGDLVGLTRSGRRFWTNSIGGNAQSSPALDGKGVLYIGAWDKLFAIQASSPIAMGGWPMMGHDASRAANASAILPSAPRMLAPTATPAGFSFKVASPLGGFLKVETSTDLGVWTVLGTNRSSEVFLDTSSRENSRFYRVRPFHAP